MLDVLVVEDDAEFAHTLRDQLLADSHFDQVDIAATLAAARQYLVAKRPSLVVLDLGLPDGIGTDLLNDCDAPTKVVVLTVFGDEQHVLDALQRGAAGYLLKGDSDIPARLSAVADGAAPINPHAARYLLEQWQAAIAPADSGSPLSPREAETLNWLAQGCSYQEAAERMMISTHTVSDHVKRIYRKLTVNSRAAAVHEALRLGYINAPNRTIS